MIYICLTRGLTYVLSNILECAADDRLLVGGPLEYTAMRTYSAMVVSVHGPGNLNTVNSTPLWYIAVISAAIRVRGNANLLGYSSYRTTKRMNSARSAPLANISDGDPFVSWSRVAPYRRT